MISALIVDDEALARRGLQLRLQKFDDIEIVGESKNGREAVADVRRLKPDVLFLDIQMPGMDGFDVLEALAAEELPIVVFVTAYDQFAIKAFEANTLDYLLKPINDQRLVRTMSRARDAIAKRRSSKQREQLLKMICTLSGEELTLERALSHDFKDTTGRTLTQRQKFSDTLSVRDGRTLTRVRIDSIDWVEAARDYMCVHTLNNTHVLRGTMKQLEQRLDPDKFVRIHRSTLINTERVTAIRPHRNGEYYLQLMGEREFKVSRKYKSAAIRLLNVYAQE